MTIIDVLPPPRRSRRRVVIFLGTFLPALIASLSYVYLRPAEYRAAARLHIAPAAAVSQPAETEQTPTLTTDATSFLTEVQALTNRPLLQEVLERLKQDGSIAGTNLGADPVGAIQGMLHAEPVKGTHIVELSAVAAKPQLAATLVNAVAGIYRQHVADSYKAHTSDVYGDVSAEVDALDNQVAARRQAIDAFRQRYDIVSMEHKENDVLAQVEGLNKAYTEAKERLAKAQAHLQTLTAATAAGRGVVRAKDDPTLAAMEQRSSLLHEQLRDLQRRFTPQYLAIDPNATALQARLKDLDEQLTAERTASAHAALAEAQQETSAAQASVDQLQRDVANNQKQAQEFATHLSEYKTQRADLDHLESMHRAALDRLTKMKASEAERAPQVELVEAAIPTNEPWRPDYRRDAIIAVGGSLVFGLFAIWLADFLAGPSPSPAMLMQHSWAPPPLGIDAASARLSLEAPVAGQLLAPEPLPRELTDAEITSLITAAAPDARLAVVALLTGLTTDELLALRPDDIDLSSGVINVAGKSARTIPLVDPLRGLLIARQPAHPGSGAALVSDATGNPLAAGGVEKLVLYAAYDAGLDRAEEVTPALLRYTYLCYLLRQGIRAADISAVIGDVPQNELTACMRINSTRERQPLELIDRIHPALRA